MLRRFFECGLVTAVTLTLSLTTYGGDKSPSKLPAAPTNAALEKMKKLAGTWLLADKDGKATDQVASVIGHGQRLSQAMASAMDFTCQIQ